MVRRLYRWYAGIGDDPRLAIAQATNLYRQVPLLYGLLLINSLAVAATHRHSAPAVLTVTVPAILFLITLTRLLRWIGAARRRATPSPALARRQLRTITAAAGPIATAYMMWSLMLMRYGGPAQQTHAAVYLSTTVMGCLFCLMSLPQAALLVAIMVVPPFVAACLTNDEMMFAVIAINVALVVTVLLRVLFNSFDYFRGQVAARAALEHQHAELVRLNAENGRLARTDSLTGLPNRRQFHHDLDLLAASDDGATFAVGLLDLDRFKPVNDTYGHHVGDLLLVELARRMRAIAGLSTTIYRLGGDEFGLLTVGARDEAVTAAQWLCQSIAAPFSVGELRVAVGGSLGLMLSDDSESANELFDCADYALYYAKRINGGGTCVFTPDMARAIRTDRAIEAALQASALEDELRVVAQPIVAAATGTITAVEWLARWHGPLVGEVPPAEFIAIAERSLLIHDITLAVFRKGLAAARALPAELALSFNLSARDLHSPATMVSIEREIAASGIAPERIWIEVTETAVMRDPPAAARALAQLRARGIKVALDDFGTGYSSLSNLHQLPLDKVKIDRSFLADVEAARGWAVVAAVVAMCRSLALDCVAEGVETEAQREALLRIGCDFAQGYLFSPPVEPEAAAVLLHEWDRRREAA
ncbi:putative bifunctional diguanylate cyclase/phosphodiesterase [Sphingomonas sp. DT-51]|uniref:putative bifunctional diguanylate cyclase/phosphodiesterase n=1 Tax=Sphingomonas sp. DT-51 TaxID=3396165 RepID=UPI003F1D45E7